MPIITSRAIGVDTTANRPAAGTAGRVFLATDTGYFWYDNGAAWVAGIDHAGLASLTTGDPHTQYLQESVLTAKGDIYVATASATVTNQAVGANGTSLVADSSVTNGIKWALDRVAAKTSDEDITSTTLVDVAGLSVAIAASTAYVFEIHMSYQSSSAGEGHKFAVNGPSSPTNIYYQTRRDTSTSAFSVETAGSYDSGTATSAGAITTQGVHIFGWVNNGSNAGNLVARCATETGGAEYTRIFNGSWMRVQQVV